MVCTYKTMPKVFGPILIVIPAVNEEATLFDVINRCYASVDATVLVVDDGSTDGTSDVAKGSGAIVVRHLRQMGAWRAMQTGFVYAASHGYNTVITIDADGQHHPEVLQELLNCRNTDAELIIGSCPGRGSLYRQFAWWLLRQLSGVQIRDLTSGLRVYSKDAIGLMIQKGASLLEFQDLGVLMLLQQQGFKLVEKEVQMSPRTKGKSRIFFSWSRVSYYMLTTCFLCISKLNLRTRKRT
ncbi:glycosyltransferase family 2 protein [Rheinheimera sp.]|uniref:glycosyltransferase family 2 protein n=1 Tax=Rheinheimera sp. TaxID=1869214 RepID=UPI00307EC520